MAFRAHRGNFEYASPLRFNTMLNYHTDHPKDAVEQDGYFDGCHEGGLLNAGDEIKVSCIRDDGTWDKALFEVSAATARTVVVERLSQWRHGGATMLQRLKPVHRGHGKWSVVDGNGAVVAKDLQKSAAFAMCGREIEGEEAA